MCSTVGRRLFDIGQGIKETSKIGKTEKKDNDKGEKRMVSGMSRVWVRGMGEAAGVRKLAVRGKKSLEWAAGGRTEGG